MDFARAFDEQEQATSEEDQVAPGERVLADGENRRGHVDEHRDAREHDHAEDQRKR